MRKSQTKRVYRLSGPLQRSIVFLGNFSLGCFISSYLLSFEVYQNKEASLAQVLAPLSSQFNWPVETILYFPFAYLTTEILIFFSTLIMGASPFEYLAGMKNSGLWWWQRLGGGARAFVDLFLGSFLLFDLPILFRKPTLKEVLTGSFSLINTGVSSLRLLFILVLFSVLFIMAPLMKNLELVKGFVVSDHIISPVKLDKNSNFSNFKSLKSDLFHFNSLSSLRESGRYIFLPEYDVLRVGQKRKLTPRLLIVDEKFHNYGHLKIKKKISLLDLLKLGRRGNPLFALKFPFLSQTLSLYEKNPHLFDQREGKTLESFRPLFDEKLRKEIISFLKVTFELGPDNSIEHVLNYGPFLRGFVEVRQALLSLAPKGVRPEVDLTTMGKESFLRFRQSFPHDLSREKEIVESYIPIGTQNSLVFEVAWDNSLEGALSAKTFRQEFLANAQWFFDYKNIFEDKFERALEGSALAILDLMVRKNLSSKEQELFEKSLYLFYFNIVRRAITSGKKEKEEGNLEGSKKSSWKNIVDNYQRVSSFFEYQNRGEKKVFSEDFMDKWKELWNVLRLKKTSFFKEESKKDQRKSVVKKGSRG